MGSRTETQTRNLEPKTEEKQHGNMKPNSTSMLQIWFGFPLPLLLLSCIATAVLASLVDPLRPHRLAGCSSLHALQQTQELTAG
jgi:hypothetical protein